MLMLGFTGSGKTTFLAALWHHLEAAESLARLELEQLQPDRNYLNAIRDNWLSLKPVPRTPLRASAPVSMVLRDKICGTSIELSMPDLSGETYHLQWVTRKATISYAQLASECSGAFLFVHPAEVRRTHALKPANGWRVDSEEEHGSRIEPSKTWTPEQTSTQVQLVDLIQLLMYLRSVKQPLRLAVIISAWDLIKARVSPIGWVESRLPLLSQFLHANRDRFASEVFGVSAQGGDLERDRDALLGYLTPSERPRAVMGNSIDNTRITKPLEFLLDFRHEPSASSPD
jgi:hypothetical protein